LAFPGIPILPVIGNNDVMYHNQAPTATDAPSYYQDMWNVWFTGVPINNELLVPQNDIYTSFFSTGSYAYQLPSGFIVLSLNGMYPFDANQAD